MSEPPLVDGQISWAGGLCRPVCVHARRRAAQVRCGAAKLPAQGGKPTFASEPTPHWATHSSEISPCKPPPRRQAPGPAVSFRPAERRRLSRSDLNPLKPHFAGRRAPQAGDSDDSDPLRSGPSGWPGPPGSPSAAANVSERLGASWAPPDSDLDREALPAVNLLGACARAHKPCKMRAPGEFDRFNRFRVDVRVTVTVTVASPGQ
jgi:hypothetical protein